jgi:hypothetical protein
MNLLVKDVPVALSRTFKAACAARGETVRAAIMRLMEQDSKNGGRK